MDLLVDDVRVAIEAKASTRVIDGHLRGPREIQREHPRLKRSVAVSFDPRVRRTEDGIELPARVFAERLWSLRPTERHVLLPWMADDELRSLLGERGAALLATRLRDAGWAASERSGRILIGDVPCKHVPCPGKGSSTSGTATRGSTNRSRWRFINENRDFLRRSRSQIDRHSICRLYTLGNSDEYARTRLSDAVPVAARH